MTTRSDSGRKGGLTTLRRHGKDKMREWGKLGGRPRNPDYDDIRQRQALERQKKNEEDKGPPGSLGQLRRLYRLQAEGRSAESERPSNNRYKVAGTREAGATPRR